MNYEYTIRPEAINILGSSPTTPAPNYTSNTQKDSPQKHSLWGWVKQAINFIKEEVAPILTAVASLMNAWSNLRRSTGNTRDNVCYA